MRNRKIIVAIPFSHGWFWVQTCIATLVRNPPVAEGFDVKIIVVNNSLWSPAIRGVTHTQVSGNLDLYVEGNPKTNKFHASALDHIGETYNFDYLMALETDVMLLRPTWLQWFVDQMRDTDYAVGAWHHEQFINPSCTLYRGHALRTMHAWCKTDAPQDELRWGPGFSKSQLIAIREPERDYRDWFGEKIDWIAGPFAEKRGWPEGTTLKEAPSGQLKGPGWYEPGQQLHHWATDWARGGARATYTVCPTMTTTVSGTPVQTLYGGTMPDPLRQLEAVELFGNAEAAHLWGGTRALDIIKHDVTCDFVRRCTPEWLAREARFWRAVVPPDVQARTLDLIRRHGWHITGQGTDHVSDRDRAAAQYVRECYEAGGVTW